MIVIRHAHTQEKESSNIGERKVRRKGTYFLEIDDFLKNLVETVFFETNALSRTINPFSKVYTARKKTNQPTNQQQQQNKKQANPRNLQRDGKWPLERKKSRSLTYNFVP